MDTILLNPSTWDMLVDASGNIALASEPYANAQDVASAIKTFQGELYYNQELGIAYFDQILGLSPSPAFVRAEIERMALTVPNIVSAKATTARGNDRVITGDVQVINSAGQASNVQFR